MGEPAMKCPNPACRGDVPPSARFCPHCAAPCPPPAGPTVSIADSVVRGNEIIGTKIVYERGGPADPPARRQPRSFLQGMDELLIRIDGLSSQARINPNGLKMISGKIEREGESGTAWVMGGFQYDRATVRGRAIVVPISASATARMRD